MPQVEHGHKVGLVRQAETAALKAQSESRSKTFARELTAIFTRATLEAVEQEVMTTAAATAAAGGAGKLVVGTYVVPSPLFSLSQLVLQMLRGAPRPL